MNLFFVEFETLYLEHPSDERSESSGLFTLWTCLCISVSTLPDGETKKERATALLVGREGGG